MKQTDTIAAIATAASNSGIGVIRISGTESITVADKCFVSKNSNFKINRAEFDYCCNPKRGDDIMGFRSSHTATIHHKLCERALKLIDQGKEMIFVKWARNAPNRYKLILSIENKRGSLASFLYDLSKKNVDLVTITLNESGDEASADYFELIIQVSENVDIEANAITCQNLHKNDGGQILTLIPDFSKYELNKKNVKIIQKDQKRLEMFKADEHHSVFCSEDEDSCFIMKNALDLDKNLLEDYWSGLWFLSKKTDSLKLFFYCVNR